MSVGYWAEDVPECLEISNGTEVKEWRKSDNLLAHFSREGVSQIADA